MMVRTRAIDLRTSWLVIMSVFVVSFFSSRFSPSSRCMVYRHVHLAQLRLGTTSDLLGPQLHKLGLEVVELLLQFLLVLAPELGGLDLAGRLSCENPSVCLTQRFGVYAVFRTIVKDCGLVVGVVSSLVRSRARLASKSQKREGSRIVGGLGIGSSRLGSLASPRFRRHLSSAHKLPRSSTGHVQMKCWIVFLL